MVKVLLPILFGLCLIFFPLFINADNRTIGGYPASGENDRFHNDTWEFLNNFSTPQNIGIYTWKSVQFLDADTSQFYSQHIRFVDNVNLAYVAGHGNAYRVELDPEYHKWFYFNQSPGYGDMLNGGNLKFLIIQSCNTVEIDSSTNDWQSSYMYLFHGLHQLIGYTTDSYSDNTISNNYAQKLIGNEGVWQAWFDAVDEERSWYPQRQLPDYAPYPGYASAVMVVTAQTDMLGNYSADPSSDSNSLCRYWQY